MEFHRTPDTLYKFVPKDILPEDCGGKEISVEEVRKRNVGWVFQNFDFFEWHDNQTVDENKRIEKRSNADDGIDGSFRKLQID